MGTYEDLIRNETSTKGSFYKIYLLVGDSIDVPFLLILYGSENHFHYPPSLPLGSILNTYIESSKTVKSGGVKKDAMIGGI